MTGWGSLQKRYLPLVNVELHSGWKSMITMTKSPLLNLGASMILLFSGYAGSCSYTSHMGGANFEKVQIGDSQDQLIRVMGTPSVIEEHGVDAPTVFRGTDCREACVKRVWYVNGLHLLDEAWSFEIDSEGRVLRRTYWLSP